jgi:carboxyl-terminal processing protease
MRSIFLLALLVPLLSITVEVPGERAPLFQTSDRMRVETRWVVNSIERLHYSNRRLADKDMEAFLKRFIESLDLHRMYFLAEEVDLHLNRFGPTMQSYLAQGNLFPAFRIFQDYRNTALDRLEWVSQRLDQPFDLLSENRFQPDRSKLPWPETPEAADLLWENRLKYELLNELMPLLVTSTEEDQSWENWEEHKDEAIKVLRRRYDRWREYVEDIDADQIQEIFLTTLAQSYDPHSTFLSSDSLEEFSISMRNALVGIGAVLTDEDGTCTIRELLPGGPAEQGGQLSPGDRIVGVAQGRDGEFVDTVDMRLRRVVKMIRGEKGSIVRLLVRPADAADPSVRREIEIVRDEVKLTANLAQARLFQVPAEGDRIARVGVISLPSFYGDGGGPRSQSSTTRDVEELINKLKELGVEGIVLDFRRNGGGLLNEAINLTGLFLPRGPVVQVRNTLGEIQNFEVGRQAAVWDGPLLVLVSRFTASAAEIVAGALQNHRRAIVVGDTSTHGKGTVQAIFEMNRTLNPLLMRSPGGATKITIQKFYLPNGYSTQNKGVLSDIVLPSANEFLPIGESDLPNALVWDSINPQNWNFDTTLKGFAPPLNEWSVDFLREQSAQRQETLDEFVFLQSSIEWIQQQRDQTDVDLNLPARFAQRQLDQAKQDQFRDTRRNLAALNFEYEEVLLEASKQEPTASASLPEMDSFDELLDADGNNGEESAEEKSSDRIDIHLREALRITADLISLPVQKSASGELALVLDRSASAVKVP